MKYAAIINVMNDDRTSYEKFLEFHTQEDCKAWISEYGSKMQYRLIEYQNVEVKIETVISFKKPVTTRTS